VNRVFEKFMPARFRSDRTVVPVVPLNGAITGQRRLGSGMSLATVEDALKRAFAFPRAPLVAIAINSPGGLPVQSHLIHTRIRALAAEHERQVIVGIEDVAASGGYLIALAGDEIVAHGSSIVGSTRRCAGRGGGGPVFGRLLERQDGPRSRARRSRWRSPDGAARTLR